MNLDCGVQVRANALRGHCASRDVWGGPSVAALSRSVGELKNGQCRQTFLQQWPRFLWCAAVKTHLPFSM